MKKTATFLGGGLIAASLTFAGPALADSSAQPAPPAYSQDAPSAGSADLPAGFNNHIESQLGSMPWCGGCGFWVTGAQSAAV